MNKGASSDSDVLAQRFEKVQKRLNDINAEVVDKKQRTTAIKRFFKDISNSDEFVTELSHPR